MFLDQPKNPDRLIENNDRTLRTKNSLRLIV